MINYVIQEYLCYILFYSIRLHCFQRIIFLNPIYKRKKLGGPIGRVMWTPKVIHVLIHIIYESVSLHGKKSFEDMNTLNIEVKRVAWNLFPANQT